VSLGTGLLLIALLLLANAFFVASEFALVSVRRERIQTLADEGYGAARWVLWSLDRVSLLIAAAQLGVTVCSVALGVVGEPTVAHLLEKPFEAMHMPEQATHVVSFGLALLVVTWLHVVIGEMVPKNLTLAGPDRASLVLGPVLIVLMRILKPIVVALNAIANATLRLMRVEPRDEVESTVGRDEVEGLVAESRREGLMDSDEHDIVQEAIAFSDRRVHTVLIEVSNVVVVPPEVTPEQIESHAGSSGYTRFPVWNGSAFEGYVHLKDVLVDDPEVRTRPVSAEVVRELPEVGLETTLVSVLSTLRRTGTHIAQVIDADATPRGIVALDDVLASLVPDRPDR
jgi:CBS domain containing-hemolysin-like protein